MVEGAVDGYGGPSDKETREEASHSQKATRHVALCVCGRRASR